MEGKLEERMNEMLIKNQEGLVIKVFLLLFFFENHNLTCLLKHKKQYEQVYEPNARHWIKLKRDYLKGMADSVDVVTLGAYWGTGKDGGLLNSFLMGAYDTKKKIYRSFCKVSNGLSDEKLRFLILFFEII